MADPAALDDGANRPAQPMPPTTRSPLPPLGRRALTAAPKPVAPSLWARAGHAIAPYALLLVVLAPFAIYYRLTLFTGQPRVLWVRPYLLSLLAIVPLGAGWLFHFARRRQPAMTYSRTADLAKMQRGVMQHLARLPQILRLVALALFAVALARPQHESADILEVEGIDIVIALDVSLSMSEADLGAEADRLTVAKQVLARFVEKRKSDRIGLVIFGREAFTQCPLTLDYHALTGLLGDVKLGLVDGKGTAIGNALATALNRLRKSDARSKVIILLTDGDNNAGNVSPQQAAKFAQSLGVKIFTVLIGRDVDIDSPQARMFRVQPRYPVNPKLLEEIAGSTGGTPYLATDTAALDLRFQSILDELDRSRIRDQKGKPRELLAWFVAPGILLLLLEIALSLTRFRRFP